jgi:hypothetical protein
MVCRVQSELLRIIVQVPFGLHDVSDGAFTVSDGGFAILIIDAELATLLLTGYSEVSSIWSPKFPGWLSASVSPLISCDHVSS